MSSAGVSALLVIAGCVDESIPVRAEPVDASALDGGADIDAGACERIGEACGPPEACCHASGHVIGMRVDLARGCYATSKTILLCRTKNSLGGGCGADTASDCWLRPLPDGGREVFFTPNSYPDGTVPGFTRCEPDLHANVTLEMAPCP